MTTPVPSLAAISRVVLQPRRVRTTVSVFCFKSAISASCFPGLTFSRLIKITDSSDMAHLLLFRTHQGRPEGRKRIATWRFFLENQLKGVCTGALAPVRSGIGGFERWAKDLVNRA